MEVKFTIVMKGYISDRHLDVFVTHIEDQFGTCTAKAREIVNQGFKEVDDGTCIYWSPREIVNVQWAPLKK